MVFVEFLGEFLSAHAHALQRLAALMTEDIVIQLLEDERPHTANPELAKICAQIWKNPSVGSNPESSHVRLDQWIKSHKLPAFLEFHVWSYPGYRSIIEGPLTPEALPIPGIDMKLYDQLLEACRKEAEQWMADQKLDEPLQAAAKKAVDFAWVRFRTEFLKRQGRNPLSAI